MDEDELLSNISDLVDRCATCGAHLDEYSDRGTIQ